MGGIVGGITDAVFGKDGGSRDATNALKQFKPVGLSGGGLNASFDKRNNRISMARSGEADSALRGLSGAFANQSSDMRSLLSQVKPGFGALTDSAVNTIRNRREQSVGNLRENLSRRRVLGSSFAQDALARADNEFAQSEADVRAKSFLEELDVTSQLMTQANDAAAKQFQSILGQLQFEAGIGAQLATGATATLGANSQLQAELLMEASGRRGEIVGSIIGGATTAATAGAGGAG